MSNIYPMLEFQYSVLYDFADQILDQLEAYSLEHPGNNLVDYLIQEIENVNPGNSTDILSKLFSAPTPQRFSKYISNDLADLILSRFFDAGFIYTYFTWVSPESPEYTALMFEVSPLASPLPSPIPSPPASPPPGTPPLTPSYPMPLRGAQNVGPTYDQTYQETPSLEVSLPTFEANGRYSKNIPYSRGVSSPRGGGVSLPPRGGGVSSSRGVSSPRGGGVSLPPRGGGVSSSSRGVSSPRGGGQFPIRPQRPLVSSRNTTSSSNGKSSRYESQRYYQENPEPIYQAIRRSGLNLPKYR